MSPYRLLSCVGLALILVGSAFPVGAQSPVSLRVLRPTGPFPTVEGGQAYILRQGSTLEVGINVDASNRVFRPDNVEAVWVGEQMRPGEFPSAIGPRVLVGVDRGGVRRLEVRQMVRLPADLFSCGRHNLRAVAEFKGDAPSERGNVASPEPATKVYLDCGPPTIEIHAPSAGACIRPGTSIDLRLTASDDVGIRSLTHDLGPLGWQPHLLTALEPRHAFTISVGLSDPHRNGVISASFEAEDWAGNKLARGLTFTLDGDAPPTIGMDQPSDGQQASTASSLTISGQASDPGCGLDRIEIGLRKRGTSDPYRVVKTVRDFASARSGFPTPSFTYRAELPAGTLAPGLWDLQAEAISQTGRRERRPRDTSALPLGLAWLLLHQPGARRCQGSLHVHPFLHPDRRAGSGHHGVSAVPNQQRPLNCLGWDV